MPLSSDAWLQARGLLLDELPGEPVEADHPLRTTAPWACYRWGRRTYAEVMDSAAVPEPAVS